jgi:hypothetical protein
VAHRIVGPELKDARDHYWNLLSRTRERATEARQLLAGELGVTLPETVQLAGADAWVGDTPHRLTGPQRVRQKLIAKQWETKRPRTSAGQRAGSVATRIEQPLDAIMKDDAAGFPWEAANDVVLIEGIVFGTVSLDYKKWREYPLLYRKDAPSLTVEHMEKQYAVDGEGRFRGDDGYDASTVDPDKARRERDEDARDHMARHLPFSQNAYSIRSCAPIFGGNNLNPKLEGLIIETHWAQREFKHRGMYVSRKSTDKDASQLYPLGAIGEGDSGSAFGGLVKVIEAWLVDEDGLPYISYCVDGGKEGWLPAWRMGKDEKTNRPTGSYEHYVHDLSKIARDKRGEWHGFTRLPVSWGWGLGWSTTDLDKRTMPYTKPFQQGWRNFDMLMATAIASCVWLGFPALIEKVAIASMDDDNLDEEKKKTPDIQPLKITEVVGDITNVGGQGPSPAVFELMRMALGENKAEQAGGDAEGASSGFAMTLQEALESDALATCHETVMKMAGQHASYVLEGAKILGECYEPVLVYKLPDVLLEQKNPSDTGKPMPLDPALIGTNYDVKAITVKVPGENPAKRQQDAALVKEGFYDTEWFLEQDGYPAPEEMAARVAFKQLMESPEGQAATMRMVGQYVSDQWVDQILDAIANAQANQQGLPTGLADGTTMPPEMLSAGPQAAGGMDGLAVANPAEASLNATVAGPMQTSSLNRVAAAGGEMPAAYTGAI